MVINKIRAREFSQAEYPLPFREDISFSFGDQFRASSFQGVLREKILRKSGIAAAAIIEKLRYAAAVVFARNLHGSPGAVFQLVIRVDGGVVVDLLVLRVLRTDHSSIQLMRGTVYGQAKFAALAVSYLDPVHLLQVHRVAAAKTNDKAGLVEAKAQQIVDVSFHLLLEIRNGSDRQLIDATAVERPAAIAVVKGDDNSAMGKIQTIQADEGQEYGVAPMAEVLNAGFIRIVTEIVEADVAGKVATVAEKRAAEIGRASCRERVFRVV